MVPKPRIWCDLRVALDGRGASRSAVKVDREDGWSERE